MKLNEIPKYVNDKILDIDELSGTDLKINPDFYLHNAIVKAQECLVKENMKEGFAQFRIMVEHIETLCKAANMLPENYEEQVKNFKVDDEEDSLIKAVKIGQKKLEILMTEVFESKTLVSPLKL